MAFSVGDKVVEKTKGTPRMLVLDVAGDDITCQWFTPENTAVTRVISASQLAPVPTR